jgi:phage terminase large subunit
MKKELKRTTAINKILALKKRKKVIQGGTSAGKTFGILPILIDIAAKAPELEISVVSETIPHLRKGAMKDFINIMKIIGRWQADHWSATHLKYTFTNGSYIEFFGTDQAEKVVGPRRDILYVNECNHINYNTYHQMEIRTNEDIYLDFNPVNEFWVHTELLDDVDVEFLKLDYLDNEGLGDNIKREIEKKRDKAYFDPQGNLDDPNNIKSEYWANWWKVYGLGELGSLQGTVYSNWGTIDHLPIDARRLGYGLDFGYTNDPTALIAVYKYDDQIIFDEVIYQKGLSNRDISLLAKKKGITNHQTGYADSAEPKSIDELISYGLAVVGVSKGKDSIKYGIQLLQEQRFLVTTRSTNIINELRNYVWDTDRTGRELNTPIDNYNHAMDAMRYWAMESNTKKREFYVF